MATKKVEESNFTKFKNNISKKTKKFDKIVQENLMFFVISIFCFVAGLVMWVLYKDTSKTKNRSLACLYGSMFGMVLVFMIGLIMGVKQIV